MNYPYCAKHEWPGGMEKPCPDCAEILSLMADKSELIEQRDKAYREVDAMKLQVRAKDETIQKLCEALVVRRAMEPKHSDPEHDCPECELVAEIIHSERTDKRKCVHPPEGCACDPTTQG